MSRYDPFAPECPTNSRDAYYEGRDARSWDRNPYEHGSDPWASHECREANKEWDRGKRDEEYAQERRAEEAAEEARMQRRAHERRMEEMAQEECYYPEPSYPEPEYPPEPEPERPTDTSSPSTPGES